jgi:hypothetical protein
MLDLFRTYSIPFGGPAARLDVGSAAGGRIFASPILYPARAPGYRVVT